MSLTDKLLKVTKSSSVLTKSELCNKTTLFTTKVPIINLITSGDIDGGPETGILQIVGDSKCFKTNLALFLASEYMKTYEDSSLLFFDCEFGASAEYFSSFGIDSNRVIHEKFEFIEELRSKIAQYLTQIERGDKVFIFIDSIGNVASKKEIEDAIEDKSAADMTRAKAMNSLFRIITPQVSAKNIFLVAINHYYECGTEKMKVLSENGPISLKDLRVGDMVYTTNGLESVKYHVKHDNAPVTSIELDNGDVLEFTPYHRFMVNGKWKYVRDLQVGDDIDVM